MDFGEIEFLLKK